MCILLVEDEQNIRELVLDCLEDEGFDMYTASTSEEAVILIENLPEILQLLVTDVDLPGKHDGIRLARLTQHYHPSLPGLYMTGRPDKVGALGSKEALLVKPFSLRDLIHTVRQLLTNGASHSGLETAW